MRSEPNALVESQQIEHSQLAGKALGGGDGLFFAGAQRHGHVCFAQPWSSLATLVMARVFWPRSRASRRAASVSEVSPDCEITSTLGWRTSALAFEPRQLYSLAYSTSTARPHKSSSRISPARPLWRLEPEAAIRISPSGMAQSASRSATSGRKEAPLEIEGECVLEGLRAARRFRAAFHDRTWAYR